MTPLAVGLAGAGPWAAKAYAPMLAAGPETRLACVWSRREGSARAVAAPHGAGVAGSFEDLLACCDAVAFAVPPDVQARLAVQAARAGRHLMLDKPLAFTLDDARRVVEAVEESGVVSQILLTHRFRPRTAAFLAGARRFPAVGARFAFFTRAFLDGPYANAWRREYGALYDLGPHAFDLMEAALGPIEDIRGRGDSRRWVALSCVHAGGVVCDLAMTGVTKLPQTTCRFEIYGEDGAIEFDAVAAAVDEPWSAVRRSFAAAVRAGRPPDLDARHGLRLQELIHRAERALR